MWDEVSFFLKELYLTEKEKTERCAQDDQDAVTKGAINWTQVMKSLTVYQDIALDKNAFLHFLEKRNCKGVEVNCLRGGGEKRIGCLCLFLDSHSHKSNLWFCFEEYLVNAVHLSGGIYYVINKIDRVIVIE